MNPATIRLGLTQMPCGDDPDTNVRVALDLVRTAAAQGAQVVCLQELFRSRYFPQREDPALFRLAEAIPGPTTAALADVARELEIVVVGSVFERRAAGLYHNSAVVIDADGRLLGVYRKMHIPHDPHFLEKYYFTPGDTGFVCFETRYARIAPLVCWDQWFPEAARAAALAGAQLIVYPTAIGWESHEGEEERRADLDAWETVQRAHAISSGVFVAAANRVGTEDELEFWGSSFVADPFGRVLARGSTGDAEVVVADCDLGAIERARQTWPFLRDRRIDAYSGLGRLYCDEDGDGR